MRRLRPGDRLTVGDGAGRWRRVRLPGGEGLDVDVDGEVEATERPAPPITIAFALTKGERPELVVQKLTELGVDAVAPFVAERSVVRWDGAKAERNVARWRVVAREAAAQSHRPWLPEVAEIAPFATLAAQPGAARTALGGGPPRLGAHAVVLVGPEGGWSEPEESAIPEAVGLGPHVLRAETAAITAGAVYAALRGGVVRST